MRILAATLYEHIGGSSQVLLAAANALRQDHDVIVRAPFGAADSVMPRALPPQTLDTPLRKLAALPRLLVLFAQELAFVRRVRPDVIYVHDDITLYLYGTIARLCSVRVVRHVHMRDGTGAVGRIRDALTDAKIFVAQFVATTQSKPWTVVRNAVVIERVPSRAADGVLSIGMIGSISRTKNQEFGLRVAVELLKRGRPFRLQIFGASIDDSYRDEVLALIAELGLETHVVLRGFVPAGVALSEIDVLLMPSHYESQGLALLEAIGSGIPAVASDIEGHREVAALLNTPSLVLVPFDPAAVADALLSACADEAAGRRVAEQFGAERFGRELRAFFDGLAHA